VIHADGVGDLVLGRPVPAAHLAAAARPEDAFLVLHYADGQEAEAFRLPGLPVVVALAPPPESEAREAPDEDSPAALAARARRAVAAARAGRPILFLVIEGPGPQTAKGIGVGSRVPDLEAAYGPVVLNPVPPTLGQDRCVVIPKGLPNLKLHFADCTAARAGAAVTRILIWRDERQP
jgi:hypothetical protein